MNINTDLNKILIVCVVIILFFCCGYTIYKDTKSISKLKTEIKSLTKELEEYQGKKDSIYFITDTIKVSQPDNCKVKEIGRDTVKIWQLKHDTIAISKDVVLNKVQKEYKDTGKYQVWISGYHDVWLDSLQLYPKTIYQKSTVIQKKRYKFGFGPQIGFEYQFKDKVFNPYIGIGLQWNLIQF